MKIEDKRFRVLLTLYTLDGKSDEEYFYTNHIPTEGEVMAHIVKQDLDVYQMMYEQRKEMYEQRDENDNISFYEFLNEFCHPEENYVGDKEDFYVEWGVLKENPYYKD
tara:strand:- start:37 stop:360 length:324 start_codon:yes stop_codon:yes gene_type:complete